MERSGSMDPSLSSNKNGKGDDCLFRKSLLVKLQVEIIYDGFNFSGMWI